MREKVFLFSTFLADYLKGRNDLPGLGRVKEALPAKAAGYELRRFKGNFHLVKGKRIVYGILAEVEGFSYPSEFRDVPAKLQTPKGERFAVAFNCLSFKPVNLLEAADLLWKKGLFLGGPAEFSEYLETILSAKPLGTETIHSDLQYIR